jgi:hypothetical protein
MVPELAAQAGMPLERANGLFRLVDRSAGLVGPPLSGVLIGVIGASSVLWIDAATFLVSAGVVAALIPPAARVAQSDAPGGATSYVQEITDGFRFLWADRHLLVFGIAFAVAGMLAEPVYGVILPVYAKEVYGSAVDLGIVFAGLAAGSLAGNLIYIAIGPRLPRRGTFILGFAVRALAFWVLLPMPPVIVVAGAIAIAALFVEPGNPLFDTIMQERVPAGMRGRVYGAFGALSVSLRPVGLLGYGLLLDQVGLRTTLFLFAGVNLLVPVCLLLLPVVQGLEQPRARPAGRET